MFVIFLILSLTILGTFGEKTLCQNDDQCRLDEFCAMKGLIGECELKQAKSSMVEGKLCRIDGHCKLGEFCHRHITPFIGLCTSKLSDAFLPQCYCKYLEDCGNNGCDTWCDTAANRCIPWPWKK